MPEMNRTDMTRLIHRKLLDADFRQCLTAQDAEGAHPIVVAMRSDSMITVLRELESVGGAANVVVPALNGFVAVVIHADPTPEVGFTTATPMLGAGSTVGTFLEMLRLEVPAGEHCSCRFVVTGQHRGSGQAELVAIGD